MRTIALIVGTSLIMGGCVNFKDMSDEELARWSGMGHSMQRLGQQMNPPVTQCNEFPGGVIRCQTY